MSFRLSPILFFYGDFSYFHHMAPKRHYLGEKIFFIIFPVFQAPRAFEWVPYCMVTTAFEIYPRDAKMSIFGKIFFWIFFPKYLGQEKNFELFGVSLYGFQSQKRVSTNERP